MRDVHEASHDSWEKLAQRRGEGDSGGKGKGGKGGKGRDARLPPPPPPPHPPQPPTHRIPPKARPVLPGTTGKGRPVPSSSVDEISKRKMSFKDVAAREVKKRRTTVKMVPRCFHRMLMCMI